MKNVPFNACDGTAPYVFISYAHSDSADVYPLIRSLHASGFPVWYDEGIEAGDDWANKVATSLEKAKLCLLFATPKSVTRDNVLREVVFAAEHGIPVAVIRMGIGELPGSFAEKLAGAESIDLAECKTYGDFVNRATPLLKSSGMHAEEPAEAPKLLKKRIRSEKKKKAARILLWILCPVIILGLLAFLGYKLLFIDVPVVIGEEAADGARKVSDSGLTVSVDMDYSDEYPYGVIFSQDREGLTLKYFPVVLTQSLGPGKDLILIPGIVGDQISEGAEKLVALGMKRFTIIPEIDGEHEKAEITFQSIPEGLRVSKDNVMELTVATDGGEILAVIGGKLLKFSGTDPVEVDYDLLPNAVTGVPGLDLEGNILEESVLGKMGLGGIKAAEVAELFVYGNSVRETYADAYYLNPQGRNAIWIEEDRAYYMAESFDGMAELSALENMESLALIGTELGNLNSISGLTGLRFLDVSGNRGIDLSGLKNFTEMTELNIAWTDFTNIRLLLTLPKLELVYADSSFRQAVEGLGQELPFEVYYLDTYVTTREELKAALENKDVHDIYIAADSNFVLREEYDLTVREDVFVTGLMSRVMNVGKLTIYGTWEMGMTDFENVGTVTVKAGGSYSGGMGCTMNYGTFLVEKNAFHSLERGQQFKQYQGLYQNDGLAVLYEGGGLGWTGGRIVNNGTFMLDASFRGVAYATDVDIDFSEIEGEPVKECSVEELKKYLLEYTKEKD